MCRVLVLMLAVAPLPAAAAGCYAVDAAKGEVSFRVAQAGAPFRGQFRRFGGKVCLEQDRLMRIDVWLDPASAETGLPEIDAAIKGKEFFAVEKYPLVAFSSTSVERTDGQRLAHGTLEIKGGRYALDVPFRLSERGSEPAVSGELTLQRLRYGIGTGEWSNTEWLGGQVKVEFRAPLRPWQGS